MEQSENTSTDSCPDAALLRKMQKKKEKELNKQREREIQEYFNAMLKKARDNAETLKSPQNKNSGNEKKGDHTLPEMRQKVFTFQATATGSTAGARSAVATPTDKRSSETSFLSPPLAQRLRKKKKKSKTSNTEKRETQPVIQPISKKAKKRKLTNSELTVSTFNSVGHSSTGNADNNISYNGRLEFTNANTKMQKDKTTCENTTNSNKNDRNIIGHSNNGNADENKASAGHLGDANAANNCKIDKEIDSTNTSVNNVLKNTQITSELSVDCNNKTKNANKIRNCCVSNSLDVIERDTINIETPKLLPTEDRERSKKAQTMLPPQGNVLKNNGETDSRSPVTERKMKKPSNILLMNTNATQKNKNQVDKEDENMNCELKTAREATQGDKSKRKSKMKQVNKNDYCKVKSKDVKISTNKQENTKTTTALEESELNNNPDDEQAINKALSPRTAFINLASNVEWEEIPRNNTNNCDDFIDLTDEPIEHCVPSFSQDNGKHTTHLNAEPQQRFPNGDHSEADEIPNQDGYEQDDLQNNALQNMVFYNKSSPELEQMFPEPSHSEAHKMQASINNLRESLQSMLPGDRVPANEKPKDIQQVAQHADHSEADNMQTQLAEVNIMSPKSMKESMTTNNKPDKGTHQRSPMMDRSETAIAQVRNVECQQVSHKTAFINIAERAELNKQTRKSNQRTSTGSNDSALIISQSPDSSLNDSPQKANEQIHVDVELHRRPINIPLTQEGEIPLQSTTTALNQNHMESTMLPAQQRQQLHQTETRRQVRATHQIPSTSAQNPAVCMEEDCDEITVAPTQENPTTESETGQDIAAETETNTLLNSMQCPTTTCRTGTTIHMVFPTGSSLKCTDQPCFGDFTIQKNWYSTKKTLTRHLNDYHGIDEKKLKVVKWCSKCKSIITGQMPSHRCFKTTPMCPEPDPAAFPFPCRKCPRAFPNAIGRRNHERDVCFKKRPPARNEGTAPNNASRRRKRRQSIESVSSSSSEDNSARDLFPTNNENTENNENTQQIPDSNETAANSHPIEEQEDYVPGVDFNDNDTNGWSQAGEDLIPNPDAKAKSDKFLPQLRDLIENYDIARWDEFEGLVNEIVADAQECAHIKITSNKPKTNRTLNPDDPSFVQKSYRRNRKRTLRVITNDNSSSCSVPQEDLIKKFFEKDIPTVDLSIYSKRAPCQNKPDTIPFTASEVYFKLKACDNTAPGPDRLTYQHWRLFDPDAKALAAVFNICLKARKIPKTWKESCTIFIPKDGDPNDPANWRPIALCPTISKLYSALITRRLSRWIEDNNILSPAQKGFRPADGCFEHTFIVEERFRRSRLLRTSLSLLSLDLADAFGSVSHAAIRAALLGSGAGEWITDVIYDMYTDAQTRLLTDEGLSDPIAIKLGVKQGEPASGVIFDLIIDPALRIAVEHLIDELEYSILALADDVFILHKCIETLQSIADKFANVCTAIGLKINPHKCFSLHLPGGRIRVEPTPVLVCGTPVRALTSDESAPFLGKPVGLFTDKRNIDELRETAQTITQSQLTPWQKIDALKTFMYPAMNYKMRTGQVLKTEWTEFDKELCKEYKKILNLPENASTAYLYGHQNDGLFGIPLAGESSDIAHVDNAFKLLTSPDEVVRNIAWTELRFCVAGNITNPTTMEDIGKYLSAQSPTKSKISSEWSRARAASNRLGVVWSIYDDLTISIKYKDTVITSRTKIFKTIRNCRKKERTKALKTLKNQGKTTHSFCKAKVSSHFNRTGDYLRFTDWRFIHPARLNLLKLNGTPYANTNPDPRNPNPTKCRKCKHKETLAHVINHCTEHMPKITARHNRIVDRITDAASGRWTIWKQNQPLGRKALRPDLVITKDKEAIIIDVTCPFEGGRNALAEARKIKMDKYHELAEELAGWSRFDKVTIEPIIVGALGSWDPLNNKIISRICSKKYAALMKKLIVSDTVRASRNIFYSHVSRFPQHDTRGRFGARRIAYVPQSESTANQDMNDIMSETDEIILENLNQLEADLDTDEVLAPNTQPCTSTPILSSEPDIPETQPLRNQPDDDTQSVFSDIPSTYIPIINFADKDAFRNTGKESRPIFPNRKVVKKSGGAIHFKSSEPHKSITKILPITDPIPLCNTNKVIRRVERSTDVELVVHTEDIIELDNDEPIPPTPLKHKSMLLQNLSSTPLQPVVLIKRLSPNTVLAASDSTSSAQVQPDITTSVAEAAACTSDATPPAQPAAPCSAPASPAPPAQLPSAGLHIPVTTPLASASPDPVSALVATPPDLHPATGLAPAPLAPPPGQPPPASLPPAATPPCPSSEASPVTAPADMPTVASHSANLDTSVSGQMNTPPHATDIQPATSDPPPEKPEPDSHLIAPCASERHPVALGATPCLARGSLKTLKSAALFATPTTTCSTGNLPLSDEPAVPACPAPPPRSRATDIATSKPLTTLVDVIPVITPPSFSKAVTPPSAARDVPADPVQMKGTPSEIQCSSTEPTDDTSQLKQATPIPDAQPKMDASSSKIPRRHSSTSATPTSPSDQEVGSQSQAPPPVLKPATQMFSIRGPAPKMRLTPYKTDKTANSTKKKVHFVLAKKQTNKLKTELSNDNVSKEETSVNQDHNVKQSRCTPR